MPMAEHDTRPSPGEAPAPATPAAGEAEGAPAAAGPESAAETSPAEPAPESAPAAPPPPPECPGGQVVEVRPGDTLFLIARRHGVSLAALLLANPQITEAGRIFPGQRVCVPSAPPGCPGGRLVVVRPGDTLFSIGQRAGVPVEAMIAANPQLPDPGALFPGQIVCVPRSPATCAGSLYVVRPGDTLDEIARASGVALEALIAANPQISNPNRIAPGEVVCIPPASGEAS